MTAGAHGQLAHHAYVYSSRDEFAATLGPWTLAGLEAGDRVFAATSRANFDALSDSIGADAAGAVEFADAEEWYRHPYRTLRAYGDYLSAHAGERVRVIGEPVWHGRSPSAVREWARYESVLNVVFAGENAWIICPYDAAALPGDIVDHALRAHPDLFTADGAQRSDEFVSPERFWAEITRDEGPAPDDAAVEYVRGEDFRPVRRFVADQTRALDFDAEQAQAVVLGVHELATNAVKYGSDPVTVRAWTEDGELVCEVEDSGPGLSDPFAGCSLPGDDELGSRGLWTVRQVSDSVDVLRRPNGLAVRLRVRPRNGDGVPAASA